jgi:hypothetical protein
VLVKITQADIAQLAGSSRESASRFIAVLERAGVITQGGADHGPRPRRACQLRLLSSRRGASSSATGSAWSSSPRAWRPTAPRCWRCPRATRGGRDARRGRTARGARGGRRSGAAGRAAGRRALLVHPQRPAHRQGREPSSCWPTSAARSRTTTPRSSRRAGWPWRTRRAS